MVVIRPASSRVEVISGANLQEPVQDVLERARRSLDRLQLQDAEQCFIDVLRRLSCSTQQSDQVDRLAAEALFGLGEVNSRLSRHVGHKEMEWLRRMFHSLLLYSEAMDVARRAADQLSHRGQPHQDLEDESHNLAVAALRDNLNHKKIVDDIKHFQQITARSLMQVKLLEECLKNDIRENILKFCVQSSGEDRTRDVMLSGISSLKEMSNYSMIRGSTASGTLAGTVISEPGTQYPAPRSHRSFDSAWLHNFLLQSVKRLKPQQASSAIIASATKPNQAERIQVDISKSTVIEYEPQNDMNSLMLQQTKCKINYSKVQEAIRKLVSEASSGVWERYDRVYKQIPRDQLEKRLASEVVARLTPGSLHHLDLVNVFEDAIRFEDESEYFESQSIADGSLYGELSESHSSFTLDRLSSTAESQHYDSESDEEDSYETLEVGLFPCAVHTSGILPPVSSVVPASCSGRSSSSDHRDVNYTSSQFLSIPQINSRFGKTIQAPSRYASNCPSARAEHSPDEHSSAGMSRSVSEPGSMNDTNHPMCVESPRNGRTTLSSQFSQPVNMPCSSDNVHKESPRFEGKPITFRVNKAMPSGLDHRGKILHGILTLWRQNKSTTNKRSQTVSVHLPGIEELSPLTEKCRNLQTLETDVPLGYSTELGESRYLNEAKLCQTIGYTAMKVAESLSADGFARESCELYKFALGIFLEFPPELHRIEIISEIILNIGVMKCRLGDTPMGVELLEECISLYGGRITVSGPADTIEERRDMFRVSGVSFKQGNALLAPDYRQDLLMTRVMKLAKQHAVDEDLHQEDLTTNDIKKVDVSNEDSDDEEDEYSLCTQESISSYKNALSLLDRLERAESIPPAAQVELHVNVLISLADCYVISGQLEKALALYERTVSLFQRVPGSGTQLMPMNAHALCMIGTLNFLLRNFIRAATMYETAHQLRQRDQSEAGDLEGAWSQCMLSLCYNRLAQHHKCIRRSISSFTLYVRLYGGRLLDLDPLSHWFIVQALYLLGNAYLQLGMFDKTVSYLILCRNMATRASSGELDNRQVVAVLCALADSHRAVGDEPAAVRYYQESLEYCDLFGDRKLEAEIRKAIRCSNSFMYTISNNEPLQSDLISSIKNGTEDLLKNFGMTEQERHELQDDDEFEHIDTHMTSGQSNEISEAMAGLAILCHTKALLSTDQIEEHLRQAEEYYEEAMRLDTTSAVSVQYALFKYTQSQLVDALLTAIPLVFSSRGRSTQVIYHGIETVLLPPQLQSLSDEESLALDAKALAGFLAVLCYMEINLREEAEDALIQLYHTAWSSSSTSDWAVLGYACLQVGWVREAVEVFEQVYRENNIIGSFEFWTSLLVLHFQRFKTIIKDQCRHVFSSSIYISSCQQIRNSKTTRPTALDLKVKKQINPQPSYQDRLRALKADSETRARAAGLNTSGLHAGCKSAELGGPSRSSQHHVVNGIREEEHQQSAVTTSASSVPLIVFTAETSAEPHQELVKEQKRSSESKHRAVKEQSVAEESREPEEEHPSSHTQRQVNIEEPVELKASPPQCSLEKESKHTDVTSSQLITTELLLKVNQVEPIIQQAAELAGKLRAVAASRDKQPESIKQIGMKQDEGLKDEPQSKALSTSTDEKTAVNEAELKGSERSLTDDGQPVKQAERINDRLSRINTTLKNKFGSAKALRKEASAKINTSAQDLTIKEPQDLTNKPPQDLTNKPSQDLTNKPPQDLVIKPSHDLINKPAQDLINKPSQDLIIKPSQDLTNKPSQDLTNKPSQGLTNKPPQDLINKPPQDLTNKPSQDLL